MTTTINASNSGSGGLIQTADASGVLALQTAGTTAVTVDASQNVGVGTTSPATYGKLAVAGTSAFGVDQTDYIAAIGGGGTARVETVGGNTNINLSLATKGTGSMYFWRGGYGGTASMIMDSVGRLIIGADTANSSESRVEIRGPANTAMSLYMLKATQVEANIGFKASNDTNFYVGTTGTTVGNAGVYLTNGGNSWNAVSDERMKTILEPIENASAKVATLRAVMGYYNNDTTQTRRPFLIAQDVQAVLPEAVNVQDVEKGTLGMSYTDTIPLLVAAIKEQQALITSLTARIAALEGTPA